jgi:hypothetical protein
MDGSTEPFEPPAADFFYYGYLEPEIGPGAAICFGHGRRKKSSLSREPPEIFVDHPGFSPTLKMLGRRVSVKEAADRFPKHGESLIVFVMADQRHGQPFDPMTSAPVSRG